MTKTKSTKRALLLSALSLLMCVSMLIGSTFAWFTDSVTSGNNKIQAGTLKIDLELLEENGSWTSIKDSGEAIFDYDKWEPGYTDVKVLRITNEGTLALKWMAKFVSENKLTTLANVIDVYVKEGVEAYPENRTDLSGWTKAGTVAEFVNTIETTTTGNLEAGVSDYLGIALKMQETAGNEYQGMDLGGAFDIMILATQYTSESDSFNNQYDANATYPEIWDGAAGTVPDAVDNTVTISTPAELAAFAAAVNGGNSYSGKTILLANDINLGNQSWTPIGACDSETYFQGTFDGQGHTIYGLNVDNSTDSYQFSTSGLFGWVDAASATIQNVKVNGATVKGSHWVGVIAGYMTGEISNCSVTNSTVIGYNVNDNANGDKVGGIVGYMNSGDGSLVGNTVSDSAIIGYRDVAGIAGAVTTDNSVKNNSVMNTTVMYEADYAAAIVSAKTAVVVDETNTSNNVSVEKVTNGIYIATAAELFAFATDVNVNGNNYAGKTVVLVNDIDLNNKAWTPIGQTGATEFKGTFDGQNHTIKNLNVDSSAHTGEHYSSGLFGWIESHGQDITIKNVNVDGATIIGHHNVAVIAGYMEGDSVVENCNVTNATLKNTHANDGACGDKTGVIAGYVAGEVTVKGCTATDCIVAGGRDAGQLIGASYVVPVDCSATNVTVSATGDCTGENIANELVGRKLGSAWN